jgi:hypothetical protein
MAPTMLRQIAADVNRESGIMEPQSSIHGCWIAGRRSPVLTEQTPALSLILCSKPGAATTTLRFPRRDDQVSH